VNASYINPFVEAAFQVLRTEVDIPANRGDLSLQNSASTSDDITVLINVVGQIQGVVLYSLSEETGIAIVSRIMGQEFAEFDRLAQSGIAELGNVITGHASSRLAEADCDARISPPTLVLGKGTLVSTLDFQRLVVPIFTELGELKIQLALND
jgi:chemotaxis protein CheX